ncbi:hypothetical protein ACFTS5_24820 [Nocardia sp. NPDC056952]|uniref:hypothetical protein n=1 Tax=Nocardia sp. NPDC056952 TaxID=3345979 RepID=UPI00362A97BE
MWEDIPGEPWSFEKPKDTAGGKAEKKDYRPTHERTDPRTGRALNPGNKIGQEMGVKWGGYDVFNRTFYSKSGGRPDASWTNKAGLAFGAGIETTAGSEKTKPGIDWGLKATAGLRASGQIRQTDKFDLIINGQAGVLAEAGGKLRMKNWQGEAGLEAFAGGKVGADVTVGKWGLGASAGAEGWAGAGAGAKFKWGKNPDTGKYELGGSLGLAWGLGGKLSGGISVDPTKVKESVGNLGGSGAAIAKQVGKVVPTGVGRAVAAMPNTKSVATGVGKAANAIAAVSGAKTAATGVGKAAKVIAAMPSAKAVTAGIGTAAKTVAVGGVGSAASSAVGAAVRKASPAVSSVAGAGVKKVGQAKKWLTSKFAAGGPVAGSGSSIGDMIPAFLSNGEFVVNAASAGRFKPLLEAINKGVPGFAQGVMGATSMSGWAGDQAKKALEQLQSGPGVKVGNPALSSVLDKAAGGLGDAASAFVSGQSGDFMKTFGVKDGMPAAARAGAQAVDLLRSGMDPSMVKSVAQQSGSMARLVAKQVMPAKALVGAGVAGGGPVDQSMTINLQTPDLDTAFQKSKTLEAQRALTYAGRW